MKLLLVDDSGTMRAVQKRCFLQLGVSAADITEAADGQTALAQFNSREFDLVVTNWNMPLMDGLTLLKEIRQKNKSIPVIMVTREREKARVLAAIQEGVSDYLVKPFTTERFKEKVQKWRPQPV